MRFLTILLLLFLAVSGAGRAAESAVAGIADLRTVIAEAKSRVFPSVVFLMPVKERYDAGEKEMAQVAGSGVILSPDGEIVTNWHVVDKAVEIRCLLYDGTARRASIVGVDKDTDLALLKLEGGGDFLPAATLGDSSMLKEGEFVMAMGAPWGLSRSVSMGILSCVNRFLPGQGGGYNLWLQTDAAINPGNSGGPLVNTDGVVVGINSLGMLFGGDMAFSIPSDTVKSVVSSLRAHGRVIRAWTGLHVQPLRDFQRNIFYDSDDGVLVSGVDPDSPADEAGIAVGQLLVAVGGRPVAGINHEDIPGINLMLSELPRGRETTMTFRLPDGATEEKTIVPTEKGVVEGGDFDCRRWNMTVKAINEFANPLLHFFKARGVYVQGVKTPGNASSAGLRAGDIILAIDGRDIGSLAECREAYEGIVADAARERRVVVEVMRSGLPYYHVVEYAALYGGDAE